MVVLSYVGFIAVVYVELDTILLEVRISGGKTSQKTLVKNDDYEL